MNKATRALAALLAIVVVGYAAGLLLPAGVQRIQWAALDAAEAAAGFYVEPKNPNDSTAAYVIDTLPFAQGGAIQGTLNFSGGVYYPRLFSDVAADGFGVKGYFDKWGNATRVYFRGADAQVIRLPGGPYETFIVDRPQADTDGAMVVTVVGYARLPEILR